MQETWVQSLGPKDPLENEMATYSSILAWKIPWTEEPGGLQSMGSQRVGHDLATKQNVCSCCYCEDKDRWKARFFFFLTSVHTIEFFLRFFFNADYLFSLYWIRYNCCFCFMFSVFLSRGMWDLSSPTRDQTHTPCAGRWSLNHTGPPGKSLKGTFVLRHRKVDLTPLSPLPSSFHETSRWQWNSGVMWISSSRWTLMSPCRSLERRSSVSWSPRPHSVCPSRAWWGATGPQEHLLLGSLQYLLWHSHLCCRPSLPRCRSSWRITAVGATPMPFTPAAWFLAWSVRLKWGRGYSERSNS